MVAELSEFKRLLILQPCLQLGVCAKDALVLWLRPSFQKAPSYLMSPPSAADITVISHRCFCNFQTNSLYSLYIARLILVALAAEASQRKREGLGRGASGPGRWGAVRWRHFALHGSWNCCVWECLCAFLKGCPKDFAIFRLWLSQVFRRMSWLSLILAVVRDSAIEVLQERLQLDV